MVFALIVVVTMNSCQMQKLTVEVYTPPKVELPPDVRGILVTSRFVPAKGEYEAVQWGYFEEVDSSLWDLSKYYAQSFSNTLDSTDRYVSKTYFDLKMLRHNRDDLPEPLPWHGLLKIVEEYKAPSIAILQGFSMEEGSVEVIDNSGNTEDPFEAKQKITVNAAWRISQPERRRMLDESIYTFSMEFKSHGKTSEEATAGLPEKNDMYHQACDWAAEQYGQIITRGYELVERDYYKDGDPKLIEAHELISEGNWTRAESKWRYLAYEGETEEIKAMACYNMALFCEKDGRLNQALGFARKANNFQASRRHLKLINNLTIKMFHEEELRERKELIRNW